MKILNNGNVIRLPLDQITVGPRLRRVSAAQVENLRVMAEDTGITTPIHVRKTKQGYELIDGAHRLALATDLGLPDIACLVVECRQDEARAMEASNNLGAARMSPLQTAVFVASWKRDYYALHPERKLGSFHGNQYTKKVVSEQKTETTLIAASVAQAFGVTERWAFKMLACGERLDPADVAEIEAAGRRVSMQDLIQIGKIGEAEARRAVVQKLVADPKATAAQARRSLAPDYRSRDPHELEFQALSKAFHRAGKRARRRFVEEHFEELGRLGAEEEERRFEAEKPALLAEIAARKEEAA
jgi:ParB family chromosome partitioning protein